MSLTMAPFCKTFENGPGAGFQREVESGTQPRWCVLREKVGCLCVPGLASQAQDCFYNDFGVRACKYHCFYKDIHREPSKNYCFYSAFGIEPCKTLCFYSEAEKPLQNVSNLGGNEFFSCWRAPPNRKHIRTMEDHPRIHREPAQSESGLERIPVSPRFPAGTESRKR